MRLPNAELAVVERAKITDLLNPEHRYGASKARFFGTFGFAVETWEVLANALREHAQSYEVNRAYQTSWGPVLKSMASWTLLTEGNLESAASGNSMQKRVRLGSSRLILWG